MPRLQLLGFPGLLQPLRRELADRLQHPIARTEFGVTSAQQALVEQRLQRVGVGLADRLGGRVRAAADEYCQPAEEPALLLLEQVVRPGDGGPEGLLARLGVSSALEQVE